MINNKQDIFAVLDQHRSQLRALGVRSIGLFGSFVRGEQRPDSDIDLLIEFDPGRKKFDTFMELSFFLVLEETEYLIAEQQGLSKAPFVPVVV